MLCSTPCQFYYHSQVDDCYVAPEIIEEIEEENKKNKKTFPRHGWKKALAEETTVDITCTSEVHRTRM